jgi:hemin uptake protein HemP
MIPPKDPHDEPRPQPESVTVRTVRAAELFLGRREIWIEHDGTRYRLRITRRNKLILQK